jgi:hypothetical protein
MESPIDDDTAISLAMQPQHMLKEITIQKRKEREAEILAATRQLHIDAGRDPRHSARALLQGRVREDQRTRADDQQVPPQAGR